MKRVNRFVPPMAAAFLLVWALSAPLAAQEVPFELQVKLILKILEFDRNFDRYGDPIKVGVTSDEVLRGFNAQRETLTIKGRKFMAEMMSSLADVGKYKVVYVDKNWKSDYKAASAKAAENKALMFAREEDAVVSGGAAISFRTVEGKPKIVMAVGAAKNQGADFPANFLQVTIVIGGM